MVMLFMASAFARWPNTPSEHRFEIFTALWCRYKLEDVPNEAFKHNGLIDWFAFALFGRHTTLDEVKTWIKGCKNLLDDTRSGTS
jgi:hypothetical protein